MPVSSYEEDVEHIVGCITHGKENSSDDSDIDQDDKASLFYGIDVADPVCIKLNDLIHRGKIDRSRILYKLLKDVVEIHCDPLHEYDEDVIEFFNSITYLGGRKVACFVRGPMNYGEGRGSHLDPANEKRMNLGGPSYKSCLKHQAGYTNEPGVWKPLSLGLYDLMQKFRASTVIEMNQLVVYPCCLANDGTALKPAIEFDERLKENVGLTFNLDIDYIRKNPKPNTEFLKENLVTEAIVSSVTSLDNKCSLPCAVEYSAKSGKTAESCHSMFVEQVKILQTCESCQKMSSSSKHILGKCYERCQCFCRDCFDEGRVCEECRVNGQISHHPAMRACASCLSANETCVKRAMFAVTADCESGNKSAFEMIRTSIEEGTIDPNLSTLTVLPDCLPVGKSVKASFCNWWLKLNDQRGNIGLLRTLRNRSSCTTMAKMRKLIPRNDHVKNVDRQDPSGVLALCSNDLTSFLSNLGYVCHTIIPELDKFTNNNRLGMYPSPIAVCLAKFGWLLFLSWDSKLAYSSLYLARLHSPIDKISVVKKNLKSTQVHCVNNVAFLSSPNGPVFVVELEDNCCYLKSTKITSIPRWNDLKQRFALNLTGTMTEIRKGVDKYLKLKEAQYAVKAHDKTQVNFCDKSIQCHIQAILLVDRELMFFADGSSSRILSARLQYDGYGRCAFDIEHVMYYSEKWGSVASICVSNDKLFISHNDGITALDLSLNTSQVVYRSPGARCMVVPFQEGVLFSNSVTAKLYQINKDGESQRFAGSEVDGCQDGPAAECQFKQPIGICVEFDNVVYVCDAQSNSLKVLTPVSETARFLSALGKLYDAFSVHKKGQSIPPRSLPVAIDKVRQCKEVFSEYERSVRSIDGFSQITLNGPQGVISATTMKSIDMIFWALERLKSLFSSLSFDDTNLLSCMTVDVEHLHSSSHIKHPLLSKKEYCRNLGNTIKESTKRLSSKASYYFTSPKSSWYPDPEHDIPLGNLPSLQPLPIVKLSSQEVAEMREFALTYGSAVRQSTGRQETTMPRHGTMPELLYQRNLHISDKVDFISTEAPADSDVDSVQSNEELVEFDTSSDEDEVHEGTSQEIDDIGNLQIDGAATFLVGKTTRFGRNVRINSRILS